MSRHFQLGLAAVLLAAGLVFLATGYTRLARQPNLTDMVQRIAGLELIRAGGTPYTPDHVAVADAPWAWLGNAVFYWPPQPWRRPYYGLLIGAVVALMAWWGYQVGAAVSQIGGLLLAASVVAISSVCTALGVGQNSPFAVAALIGSYLLAERGHRVWAGACLGVAMAKPQLAALFALPFLWTGEFVVLGVAAAYLTVATLGVCWLIGVSPVALIAGWLRFISEAPRWPGYGPYQVMANAGIEQSTALAATAVVIGGAALIAIYVLRRRPLIVLFAVAAAAGRLWSYHQLYDNLMLVFLLLATGEMALVRGDWRTYGAFLAVGLTLWMPGRVCDIVAFQWFQMVVWAGSATLVAMAHGAGTAGYGWSANRLART